MAVSTHRIAIFPGTFDPITNGHLDLIRRGSAVVDELVVGVGENPEKRSMLDQSTRVAIVAQAVSTLENVRVEGYSGLTLHFAQRCGATLMLRGLRDAGDLHFEQPTALTNRAVAGLETIFLLASPECSYISSSLIRQIAQCGGDVTELVPPEVLPHLPGRGN